MHRKQKTVKTDYSCEGRLEAESNMKVPSIVHTETAREESAEYLASQGYDDISRSYEAKRLSYRTAVYRTVRTVV